MAYKENNIEFRIASADAIGMFKTNQAHSFVQICRKEFEFNTSAREVVLLSYDHFSNWLQKMERSFLYEKRNHPSSALRELTIETFGQELYEIEKICCENIKIFQPDAVEVLKVVHSYASTIMRDALTQDFNLNSARAFTSLSQHLTDYLQHVLISMHEYNNNLVLKNKPPFICVANFCMLSQRSPFISLTARANFFRHKLGEVEFVVKNYTDEDLSAKVQAALSELGIFAKAELLEAV